MSADDVGDDRGPAGGRRRSGRAAQLLQEELGRVVVALLEELAARRRAAAPTRPPRPRRPRRGRRRARGSPTTSTPRASSSRVSTAAASTAGWAAAVELDRSVRRRWGSVAKPSFTARAESGPAGPGRCSAAASRPRSAPRRSDARRRPRSRRCAAHRPSTMAAAKRVEVGEELRLAPEASGVVGGGEQRVAAPDQGEVARHAPRRRRGRRRHGDGAERRPAGRAPPAPRSR